MARLHFTKMVGAGNDFVVIDIRVKGEGWRVEDFCKLARRLCDRKTGIGADGILVLEKSKKADFKMRVFNADGSEAEMCGNGLRCAVLYEGAHGRTSAQAHPIPQGCGAGKRISKKITVETKAGIYEGEIAGEDRVKVKMEDPKDLKLSFPLKVNGRKIKINFINTGVPHAVVFVEGLDKIDARTIGRAIRYHNEFKPKGANVNFVEIIDDNNIKIRTYERGVEGETLACGTGAVASAIISRVKGEGLRVKINVHTRGGILKIEFQKIDNKIKNVYLEGEARRVFTGQIAL